MIDNNLLSRKVYMSPYFAGWFRYRKETDLFLLYRIPPKWMRDVELFIAGKFSKMSENAKKTILVYSGLPYHRAEDGRIVTDGRLLALYKHPMLKQMWERFIIDPNAKTPEELPDELLTKPDERSYIDLNELVEIKEPAN